MGGADASRATRKIASAILVASIAAVPTSVLAQTAATAVVPVVGPSAPLGDRADSTSGFRLAAPILLSLEAGVPHMAELLPNCASREDAAGNSKGGVPVQHYAEIRLAPKLVLHGFSELGCPIDAGIGAALTYAVPIRGSTSLVFGGGLYGVPGQLPLFGGLASALARGLRGKDGPVQMAARADVVSKADGHPYHLGVQSLGTGRQQVMFGGGF